MAATLNARLRQTVGKSGVRALRRAGEVPAVMYGHGDQTRPLALDSRELEKLLQTISVENTIIELTIDGASTQALIREVQHHPTRPQILHVDFYQIHAGERIHLEVPIRLHGTPLGVRDFGGVLQEVLRELSVECLPRDIPQAIEFDIEGLNVGDSVHVRDLSAPNVRILNDGDLVVCTVSTPTVSALPEGAETEDGVGGEVQPELVRRHREDAEDVPFERGSAQPE